MKPTSQRPFNFEAASVLLIAAITAGSASTLQARTTTPRHRAQTGLAAPASAHAFASMQRSGTLVRAAARTSQDARP